MLELLYSEGTGIMYRPETIWNEVSVAFLILYRNDIMKEAMAVSNSLYTVFLPPEAL
jgi:hypothetical protein